MNHPVMCC